MNEMRHCAIGWLAGLLIASATAEGSAAPPAEGGGHSIGLGGQCAVASCRDDVLGCTVRASYNDDFGDTTEVLETFLILHTKDGLVRVPEKGSLVVIEVQGNAVATIGQMPPARFGPAGSTLSGLPGAPEDGSILLGDSGYVVGESDPDPLLVELRVRYRDLCDETPPPCYGEPQEAVVGWATRVFRPEIAISRSVDSEQVCAGTEVTYSYLLENPGNVELYPELVDDPPCDFPAFLAGDDDGDGALDPGEIWEYECTTTLFVSRTTLARVLGETILPGCEAMAEAEVTVTVLPPCAEDVTGDCVVGFADVLAILGAWGPCPPEGKCPEDVDGSGVVGFQDVLLVLAAWGPCE